MKFPNAFLVTVNPSWVVDSLAEFMFDSTLSDIPNEKKKITNRNHKL
jgi:hypothetical protein